MCPGIVALADSVRQHLRGTQVVGAFSRRQFRRGRSRRQHQVAPSAVAASSVAFRPDSGSTDLKKSSNVVACSQSAICFWCRFEVARLDDFNAHFVLRESQTVLPPPTGLPPCRRIPPSTCWHRPNPPVQKDRLDSQATRCSATARRRFAGIGNVLDAPWSSFMITTSAASHRRVRACGPIATPMSALRQRRSVVDAVARHRSVRRAATDSMIAASLSSGNRLPRHRRCRLRSNARRRCHVVAGQHHRRDAGAMRVPIASGEVSLDAIGNSEDRQHLLGRRRTMQPSALALMDVESTLDLRCTISALQ